MMTLDETMIINNMTNVIKNLEQSKRICDIIDDLNKLILTLGGRKHDEPTETKPEQEHVSIKAVTVTHVHTETKDTTVTHVHTETKDKTVTHVHTETKDKTVMAPRPPTGPPTGPAAGPPSESKPVQKQAKAKTVTKAPAPAPGRGKVECRCGLMICNAAMSRHEKGAKHKEAMAKKQKTEMKQAEGQALGMSDMDLVDIETYMTVMLPRLYKKVRGLGGQAHNNETFGFMKIEGDRDKMIDTMYNIVMPDVNRKLANALPRKFDELMNSSKKYNRYASYQTKNKYVYFIIISKIFLMKKLRK
jgi:hypothetical protein